MPVPFTDTERARVRELHTAGKTLRAIAKELGRSPATISRAAQDMGLTWDNTQTATATRASSMRAADRRARAIERLYARAEKIMDRLEAEQFKAVGYSKDGYAIVTRIDSDAIPGTDERALSGMVVNLLVAAAKLESVDAQSAGTEGAKSMLGDLRDQLNALHGSLGGHPTAKLTGAALAAQEAEQDQEPG